MTPQFDKIYKIITENKQYFLCNTCVDFDNGQDVYDIVKQDDLQYPEETFFHDPSQQITSKEFFMKTKLHYPSSTNFFGYNQDRDMLFRYDMNDDVHYFYK